jgi:hypothetical protein
MYTYRNALTTIYKYLNIDESIETIDNTNKRGIIYNFENEKIVIFVSPLSCKQGHKQDFIDTRDSGAEPRKIAWKYACENHLKFFHFAVKDDDRYNNYILSLESNEDAVSDISYRKHENNTGTGTQVNIPSWFNPSAFENGQKFSRISTPKGFYIAAIRIDYIYEYMRLFDNRPYSGTDIPDQNENDITADNKFASNILLYGVPGCGKSHKVEEEYESKITTEKNKIRVVFHPDYTYSDFVGQLLPVLKEVENAQGVKEEKLQYEFVPGPFTKIIKTAYEEPNQQCLLIIEELNRGNAPAIFGEIFQLLDRNDNGESKYGIYNADIAKYAYGGLPENQGIAINVIANTPIKLPPNLTIVATMNTSDQNVFTMDTAFQRRWQMKHIPNRFTGESLDEKTINHVAKHLPNSEISWGVFAQTINKKMHTANLGFGGTEDKSLGVYFATDNDLDDAERFAEKVLKYLWDDAFKLGRKELFNDCSQGLSAVIEAYEDAAKAKIEKQSAEDPLKKVLVPEVYNEMQKKMAEMVAEQAQTAEEKTSEEEAAKSAAEDNPAQKPAGEE